LALLSWLAQVICWSRTSGTLYGSDAQEVRLTYPDFLGYPKIWFSIKLCIGHRKFEQNHLSLKFGIYQNVSCWA